MMCKPTVLKNGNCLFPISDWEARRSGLPSAASAAVYAGSTRQDGRHFRLLGQALVPLDVRQYDEHMVVERKDASLWMLVRTRYGIGESVSTDGGRTWTEVAPSSIQHATARFFITRLKSGNLLLVKHGAVGERTGRSHLTAFVSNDDGKTWQGGLLLDERNGVSYPDGQQTADGTIYITYDFSRRQHREILMGVFTEADVLAAKAISGKARLQVLVNKVPGAAPFPVARQDHSDGVPLDKQHPGALVAAGIASRPLEQNALLFSDRNYTLAERPEALKGAHFIPIAMNGSKTLTCERAGAVWVLTPMPDRNKDSQTTALLAQGFQNVAFSEICLFDPRTTRNYCALFQKICDQGETITIHKWALPIFFP
jgi:hypothetical protein